MTLERTNRLSRSGSPLWRMEMAEREFRGYGATKRFLILAPYSCPNPDRGGELHTWFEEERGRYHWVSNSMTSRKPRGAPTFSVDLIEIEKSQRTARPKHALEYTILKALMCGDLHGESANGVMHTLFWMHFVEDDDGLTYLHKYAPRESANFYARQRLRDFTEFVDRTSNRSGAWDARHRVEDAMKPVGGRPRNYDHELGERFSRRFLTDRNLCDAIAAVMTADFPQEEQLRQVRQIVELNATRMDHVIAAVVHATWEDSALLGLRACQRLEAEPKSDFFKAVDAYVLAHADTQGLKTFLKPHFKLPKLKVLNDVREP
jgi:hypothetical protein